jgi:hypothetical protein
MRYSFVKAFLILRNEGDDISLNESGGVNLVNNYDVARAEGVAHRVRLYDEEFNSENISVRFIERINGENGKQHHNNGKCHERPY